MLSIWYCQCFCLYNRNGSPWLQYNTIVPYRFLTCLLHACIIMEGCYLTYTAEFNLVYSSESCHKTLSLAINII